MRYLILIISNLCFLSFAYSGPQCTDKPEDSWQKQESFKANLIKEGYKIKVFKKTKGNCYEIYGWDKDGNKVEIYFNPITGEKVKERKP